MTYAGSLLIVSSSCSLCNDHAEPKMENIHPVEPMAPNTLVINTSLGLKRKFLDDGELQEKTGAAKLTSDSPNSRIDNVEMCA